MFEPILVTKIHIPSPRSELVWRPRLLQRLGHGNKKKLTLVSAPAGFGKTTLLSTWIKQSNICAAWVSLEKADNSPSRFLLYVIAALQTADAGIGENILLALQSPKPPSVQNVLPYLINDIAASSEITLVLDDYHVINSQEIHEMVNSLLSKMPPNLHLVIATRSDPLFTLPLLRGRQELVELRTSDLRFSNQEAVELINHIKQVDIPEKDVLALYKRTEGWVTGLQMAILSMQNRKDTREFIQSFTGTNRYILDYLLEEVLNQQPEAVQAFLLKTSILSQLSGELCEAVTGNPDSQEILEYLERNNIFVVPLDDERHWFRYHHLFADLLYQRLVRNPSESPQELHERASQWFESNRKFGLAIDHVLEADDCDRAIKMLEKYAGMMWEHGDQARLSQWFNRIPENKLGSHPALLAIYAFALCFAGQFDAAEKYLQLAEKNCKPDHLAFPGMAATVRAHISLYSGKIDAASEFAGLAKDSLPAGCHIWRALALSIYGDVSAYTHGDTPTCEQIWLEGLREAKLAENLFFTLWICAKLVFTQRRLGQLKKAEKTFQTEIDAIKPEFHRRVAVAGSLYAVYGDVLLEWDRLEEAEEQIRHGLHLCERQNYTAGVAWSSIALVSVTYARRGPAAAAEALNELREKVESQRLPAWTQSWYTAWNVRLCLQNNRLRQAAKILADRNITLMGELTYPREVEYLTLARLLIAMKDFSQAESLLNRIEKHLQKTGWSDKLIKAQILKAILYQEWDQAQRAIEVLEPLLEIAEQEGYIRSFINEGPQMERLLVKASVLNISQRYVESILSAFQSSRSQSAYQDSQTTLLEALSAREIDVLRVVADGASNQEAALKLHIALGTVKNHLKRIYSKLEVHNRTQAVARAIDLKIIK